MLIMTTNKSIDNTWDIFEKNIKSKMPM